MSGDLTKYKVNQQDNMLFRQIRLITGDNNKFNQYCVFVSCKGHQSNPEEFKRLITDGFTILGKHFDISERSASMTRQGILSFVDSSIIDELNERITMGLDIKETVLSKYMAYRGLMFSSCHCIEDWVPKIIVIPDCYRTIKDQLIKYVVDEVSTYEDKETGETKVWTQKAIKQGVKDIEINIFDGCGFHHPNISNIVREKLSSKTLPTSIQWRFPYIKGVTHSLDYPRFFREHNITTIKDVWGVRHSINEEMVVITESMYKGLKYFKNKGTYEDWNDYWDRFEKYHHCTGIAKWNFSHDEEPLYTRANYQVLQDLNLDYDNFSTLANDSIEWVKRIVDDDIFYTYCFLGMFYDMHKPMNDYTRAILKNPEMMKEKTVREYIVNLLRKYIDEMKCGKLWLKSTFKILAPDLYALLEHAAGLTPNGCLGHDEFYSNNINGDYIGEFLIERNPHICKSEHTILNGTTNDKIEKYISHLQNVCMVNCKSLTMQKLNGADTDGDLILLIDNKTMMDGVDRNCPIVIDIEDKITALSEPVNKEHILKLILRTMSSLIGETSNCATAYHNKMPKTVEQKQKYDEYIDLLSVINGKAIDSAKTGVIFNIPRYIAKYSKPLPYFMKYASPYYSKLNKFNKAQSNMNRLCVDIERWQRKHIKFKKTYKDFDYHIMIDETIPFNEEHFKSIEKIYLDFCKEIDEASIFNAKCRNYDKYKDYFKENYPELTKEFVENFEINWKVYYDKYRSLCRRVCSDKQELANIATILCYEKYPNKNKKFIWKVASDGVLLNIKNQNIVLPMKCKDGNLEYLGKKYAMLEVYNIDK